MRHNKILAMILAVAVVAGTPSCRTREPDRPLGPTTPAGATPIPGGPMEPTPIVKNPKIPTSQQEAQDTVLRYLQQTLDALPPGTSLDSSRYGTGTGVTYCEDEPADQNAPVRFGEYRDMKTATDVTDFNAIISQTGELWKSWGWQVLERDGFDKPNRFGYAPDGYVLQIHASYPTTYPPSVVATSPCFPGNLRKDDTPRNPAVITQSPK